MVIPQGGEARTMQVNEANVVGCTRRNTVFVLFVKNFEYKLDSVIII